MTDHAPRMRWKANPVVVRLLYLVHFHGTDRSVQLADADDGFVSPGLWLVSTGQTRSKLYHAIKRQVAPDTLLVTVLADAPKVKGMAAGALKWLRDLESSRPIDT